ncbi:hypothetical protein FHR70_003591 [Microvirga lupini]|uniref:Uncharacterized protein n=1 Tax=Microvirga lupini TaxID=420324 RepID=A0A7W4VPD9_9HYPH|nr:hypothetical protein [Microvirga lupini]MBB3020505.1 hypothetical protein [Microvirga lupini]
MAAFGRTNVRQETLREPEGLEVRASVVFPDDPVRRVVVLWSDERRFRRPARIDLAGSGWTGPRELRIGVPIETVEKANGKPFVLYGFEWDYGGSIASWDGGTLGKLPGGCTFYPIFETSDTVSEDALTAVASDRQFPSDSPAMRAVMPRIRSMSLRYSQP